MPFNRPRQIARQQRGFGEPGHVAGICEMSAEAMHRFERGARLRDVIEIRFARGARQQATKDAEQTKLLDLLLCLRNRR